MKSLEDIKGLRLLYDKTEAVVRSLKGIGTEPGSYGTFITPLLMAKLPEELRILIARSLDTHEDHGSWKTFCHYLERRCSYEKNAQL